MGKQTAKPAAKALPGKKGGAATRAGGTANAAADTTKKTETTDKKDAAAAAAAKVKVTEEAASAAKAAVEAEKATPTPAVETAAPAAGEAVSESTVATATRKTKAAAEVKAAKAAKAQQGNKRRLEAMLDELGESDTDDVADLGSAPGPPQVRVLERDEISAPGDPRGEDVLVGGTLRRVIREEGTNTDETLTPFVVWKGCDGDKEGPLIVITNAALEGQLREEGLTVIDKRLLEAGGRLHAGEMGGCAKAWKHLQTAAVNHCMMTRGEEDNILRCMLNPFSQPGSLRHLLHVHNKPHVWLVIT